MSAPLVLRILKACNELSAIDDEVAKLSKEEHIRLVGLICEERQHFAYLTVLLCTVFQIPDGEIQKALRRVQEVRPDFPGDPPYIGGAKPG